MEKTILKSLVITLLFFSLMSCNENKNTDPETVKTRKIENAIKLIKKNKAINDTLIKYHNELGVEFIPCYIRQTKKHDIITFQIVQSSKLKPKPIKIDRIYKIEKINDIDVFVSTNNLDTTKQYVPEIDKKTRELIDKGYLTTKNSYYINDSYYVSFVFCKENDKNFKIINLDFLAKEEHKMRSVNKPFLKKIIIQNAMKMSNIIRVAL